MNHPPSYDELAQRVAQLEAEAASYQAELANLKNSEIKYQSLFQNVLYEVHVWKFIFEPQGAIKTWSLVDANPATLKSWGTTLDKVIGKTTDEIFPGVNATESFRPIVEKVFAENKPYLWEQEFAGTDQTLYMTSIPLGDQFISTGVDVSPIKRAEKSLAETTARLSESIKAGNVGLWEWDLQTNKANFSKECKQQIGYLDSEISNDFIEWRTRVHPDDSVNVMTLVEKSIECGSQNHEVEFRFRHKDGSYRWIFSHGSVLKNKNGEPIKMIGSHIDITKFKKMEQSLSQTRKMEALGSLASGIAHDFNNLLAPIMGYTELARARLDKDSKEFAYLNNVEESANRARSLVEKILIINRSSAASRKPVLLQKLVEEVITVVRASAAMEIDIHASIDDSLQPILAEASDIYQLILNLFTNAIQAINEAGVLDITLGKAANLPQGYDTILPPNEHIVLTISDTGCGMDSSTPAHIFDPFFTTKDTAVP